MKMQGPNETIDWEQIAKDLNAESTGSTELACEALENIIGHDNIKAAVDYYVFRPSEYGSELIRSILWHLHSKIAMHRCYEIYTNSEIIEARISAVELLRVVADAYWIPEVLSWIPEFLNDPEEGIQNWGIGIIDQLVFSGRIDEDKAKRILNEYQNHKSDYIKEKIKDILKYIEEYRT